MELVNHDVAQILEQLYPFRVVGQNAGMQHVRIGENDVGFVADGAAGILRCIAIVGMAGKRAAHGIGEALQFEALVFSKRLCREEEDGARGRIGQNLVDDRQVVASVLPLAVGVTTTAFLPAKASSTAAA
jgi:hypothetical protein